ncbi:MAG: hypothetical protein UT17_C0003G0277 [Candidatus Woesebacteria bacterium GW2011_GWB1_39_10]|uniref:Uncharacterized protein n=2 Tax=Candidatus Woeseibacteriota TaxID=1752722 RepID=A0A0G0P2C8_9BACT|nr:MAG: hypothetical protein UT17_C0003G0277 [Candidatus Woesebacteria bacterium GW2011_GWB1_39_10]KKS91214.1 MAG: hypothetical protein UV66_C0001G0571 [Candidatus Woesebacteria bacterium GW2011_GWA1_43_12]
MEWYLSSKKLRVSSERKTKTNQNANQGCEKVIFRQQFDFRQQ